MSHDPRHDPRHDSRHDSRHDPAGLAATLDVRRGDSFRLQMRLAIPPGRTVALLGPNGAGKSTAVAALAGLAPLHGGRIELGGVALDAPADGIFLPPEARRIGVVFQDPLLFPHLTVLENVAFGVRSSGRGTTEALNHARSWLERLDLAGLEGGRPRDLSGGQAQRVALARTLATDPRLLLLDEPLSALDVTARTEVRRHLLDHLRDFRGPRLLITHDPAEAFLLADEIHVLQDGAVTQSGPPDEIRLRPTTPWAADFGGTNLVDGVAEGGVVDVAGHPLQIADRAVAGAVLIAIRPSAISLHSARPEGSSRNQWRTTVERVERLGDRTRLQTGGPLPLAAEMTTEALDELGLAAGSVIWIAIKATDIGVQTR